MLEELDGNIKDVALAAHYFLAEWYSGTNKKVRVVIVGNQVYIESIDHEDREFNFANIDLMGWIFALRAEEARISAIIYKSYSEKLVTILEKIENTLVDKTITSSIKKIVSFASKSESVLN